MSTRDRQYLWLCLATTRVTAVGFSSTYFGPMLRGAYPAVSPTVHLHGWTFFLWYLLLPLQAGLVAARRVGLHRTLGYASLALAVAMSVTELVVVSVQMRLAAQPDGSPFWQAFGPGVFVTLMLFSVCYTLAVYFRTRLPRFDSGCRMPGPSSMRRSRRAGDLLVLRVWNHRDHAPQRYVAPLHGALRLAISAGLRASGVDAGARWEV